MSHKLNNTLFALFGFFTFYSASFGSPYTSLDFPLITTSHELPELQRTITSEVDADATSASYTMLDHEGGVLAHAKVKIEDDLLIGEVGIDPDLFEHDIERFIKHLEIAAASSKCKALQLVSQESSTQKLFESFGFKNQNSSFNKLINIGELQSFFIRNQMNKADKKVMEVDIGRKSEYLGNPFLITFYYPSEVSGDKLKSMRVSDFDCFHPKQRDEVCDKYYTYLHSEDLTITVQKKNRVQVFNSKIARKHAYETKGKILGCYCAPDRCHGNTLFAFANDLEEEMKPYDCCDHETRRKNLEGWSGISFMP